MIGGLRGCQGPKRGMMRSSPRERARCLRTSLDNIWGDSRRLTCKSQAGRGESFPWLLVAGSCKVGKGHGASLQPEATCLAAKSK